MGLKTFHRGIRDLKIAVWNNENSYGTAYDLHGARNATLVWVVQSDQLEGDDVVLDQYTKPVSVTVRVEMAAVDLEAIKQWLGGTLVSNASYEDLVVAENHESPFIAIAGRVVASSSNADFHFFVPKAKIAGDLTLTAQLNQYMIPQAEFRGVNEGSINGMMRFRKFTAPTGVEIPLRTTTGGV